MPKKKELKHKKIGLALGGGGAKGLSHIKFLKILDELNIQPSIISGSSMGALIGAIYASGMPAEQIDFTLSKMAKSHMTRLVDLSFNNRGIIKGKKIMNLLKKNLPIETFEDLKIPLLLIATDYWKQSQVILNKGNLLDAIRASISIPGIFEPIKIDNQVLIDGGVINPVPYDIIRDKCDYLIAIDVISKSSKIEERVPNMIECILTSFNMMHHSIESHKDKRLKPDLHIKVDMSDIGILEFNKIDKIDSIIADDLENFKKKLQKLKF